MVAIVIALPKASNHLWYHMFAPGDLLDTYMTGFMVSIMGVPSISGRGGGHDEGEGR